MPIRDGCMNSIDVHMCTHGYLTMELKQKCTHCTEISRSPVDEYFSHFYCSLLFCLVDKIYSFQCIIFAINLKCIRINPQIRVIFAIFLCVYFYIILNFYIISSRKCVHDYTRLHTFYLLTSRTGTMFTFIFNKFRLLFDFFRL